MASKKPKAAPTDEELLAQFDDLTEENEAPKKAAKPGPGKPRAPPAAQQQEEAELFTELENLTQERPKSRPQTPSGGAGSTSQATGKRLSTTTPPPGAPRSSEERPTVQSRKSGEGTRSFHQGMTPAEEKAPEQEEDPAEQSSGGGWWGGFMATASAAVKQAEAIAKEIQKNEEAQRWAEQVRGNVGALRNYGGELRTRAIPTFTNILHTLAPPISSHESLQIHITHDFIGYPSLDPLIYQTFSRVMAQVEGGELMVIQRGQESSPRRGSEAGYTGSAAAGWSDGPWWRQLSEKRDLGAVKGLVEGTKLSKVSAESYATDYFSSRGGVEEAAKLATQTLSESNPTRSSDIFLAIQAISHQAPSEYFSSSSTSKESSSESGITEPDTKTDDRISFAVYLFDPIHNITFHSLTQTIPEKWITWLDNTETSVADASQTGTPEEIKEIIESGGVDPREWVAEWVEEVLGLGIGIVAQRYVAKRMGVGEGGFMRGKARESTVDALAGEVARAGVF